MKSTKRTLAEFNEDLNEYYPDWDDRVTDERLFNIKDKLESLEKYELNLILLYAKYSSYRKVADMLGVNRTSVYRYLVNIKNKLCSC